MALDVLQGRPVIEATPSGLRTITRFYKLNGEAAKVANINTYLAAFGTPDVEFTTALLVDQRIERRSEQGLDVTLTKVFQELADNALTETTEVVETTSFDGRRVTRTTYLCRSEDAASLRPAIGGGVFQVDVQKKGPVATVLKYEIELTDSGFVLSDSTDEKNNGKLTVRTIRTIGEAAATPSGFTLVSTVEQNTDGYTTYVSTFAKGEGRVSTDVAYKQNGKLKITTIRYLDTDDGAGVAGTLVNDDSQEQDGYTLYIKGYAEIVGDGITLSAVDIRQGGKLILYRRIRLGTAPSTPSATIGGTVVQIQADQRQEDGFTLYDYRWAEGSGVIEKRTQAREGGLRLETWVSLGASYDDAFMLPDGILAAKDQDEIDGTTRWTVTCWQKSDGTDPTSGTALSYSTKRPFMFPGRAKVFTRPFLAVETLGPSFIAYAVNVLRSPPAALLVDATIKITYQSSATIGALDNTLWNPSEWATMHAQWEGWNIAPKDLSDPLPNYRAVTDEVHTIRVTAGGTSYATPPTVVFTGGSGTGAAATAFISISGVVTHIVVTNGGSGFASAPTISFTGGGGSGATATAQVGGTVTFTAGAGGYNTSCLGDRVYANSSGQITVTGGPTKPDGLTLTIEEPDLQPAFIGLDGTQYYRKVQVYATIPTQAALGV